jgi:hypothetical protein
MKRFDLRRDGFALGILALLVVLLAAGLTGTSRVFGYGLVAFFGLFAGLGFVRRGDPVTWWPPAVVTAVLLLSFMGMFANESAAVQGVADTVLGFQPGTAFLVYGLWLPSFFTLGLSFTLLFDRLTDDARGSHRKDREP